MYYFSTPLHSDVFLTEPSISAPHVCGLFLLGPISLNANFTVINDPDGNPDPIAHHQ